MKREDILHKGKVVEAGADFISVEIVSESACASCHAASLCGVSEFKTKLIQVPTPVLDTYQVGETVDLVLKASMGHKAVWIAYVAPLLVLLGVILILFSLGLGELVSAGCAFVAVAVYYLLVYAFRGRLKDEYVFEIRKITNNN